MRTRRTRTARISPFQVVQEELFPDSRTVGTKGREGREKPKEPRANGNVPRVFTSKRDREARIGWIGEFVPDSLGHPGQKYARDAGSRKARRQIRMCHVSSWIRAVEER
ncbi:hypothetical protein KI387_023820, partial [Taxus chinensis]